MPPEKFAQGSDPEAEGTKLGSEEMAALAEEMSFETCPSRDAGA